MSAPDPYAECKRCGCWHYTRGKRKCSSPHGHDFTPPRVEPVTYSARLRAAEAEVERLRGALRGAIEELDTIPEDPKRFARVAGMTIPLVRGGLSRALLPAKARAALGEP